MISFNIEGTRVLVKIEAGYPIKGRVWTTVIECGTDWAAHLLYRNRNRNMNDRFRELVSQTKKKAYDLGWSEGRGHKEPKREAYAFGCSLGDA